MKKAHLLICIFLLAGFCLLQAQDKDKVVYIKKYDFDTDVTNDWYLSAEEGEEEVTATKTSRPYKDEEFTLEYVKGEEWESYYYIKNSNNEYMVVEDEMLVLSGTDKPAETFIILKEGENEKKEGYYRMYFDSRIGIDISPDGDVKADGSSAGFLSLIDVPEGAVSSSGFLERPSTYDFRITVFTSNGVFTETSSNIDIKVYYKYQATSRGTYTSTNRKVDSKAIGRVGNRPESTYFSITAFGVDIDKVVITNKGGGINESWKVDWFQVDKKSQGQWYRMGRGLMGYWVNKNQSMSLSF